MEEFLLTVAVVIGLALLILPVVGFILTVGARKRITALEVERADQEDKLRWLYDRVRALEAKAPATDDVTAKSAPAQAQQPLPVPLPDPVPEPVTETETETEPVTETEADPDPVPEPDTGPIPVPPRAPPRPTLTLEQRMATWFTRIGAGALLLGALYFFKYAVDSEWIGPMGRVLLGALAGAGMLVGAEVVRSWTKPAFVQVLVGIGLALLFISSYASSAFYGLINTEVAFSANLIILLVGALLAWRYESEAILVLVAVAGFANPVMLSTGHDRPIALFSYLLLIGAVVLTVGTLRKLPIAITVTIIGTAVLFVGWYGKYFAIHDLRGSSYQPDVPPEELVGKYLSLSMRLPALIFVALATVEWLAVAVVGQHKKTLGNWMIAPVATAALLLCHVGATALLHDQDIALGACMVLVGVSSVLVMRHLGRTKLLVLPMLVAFMMLAGVTSNVDPNDRSPFLLLLLGVWSTIYVVAFLYDALRAGRTIERGEAILASVALYLFILLAGVAVLPAGYHTGAIAAAVASLLAGLVAYRAERPGLLLSSVIVGFLGLVAASVSLDEFVQPTPPFDTLLIVVHLAWSLGFVGLTLHLAPRKAYPRLALLAAVAASALGLIITIASTAETVPTLRALLTALFGAASLGAATWLSKKEGAELYVTVFAAQALALFAAAAGFGLSGATITAAWAVMFVATAIIFARSQERAWLAVALALAAAVLLRILAFDIVAAQAPLQLFHATRGGEGALSIPVLFNTRAYGLIAGGLTALVAAMFIRRAQSIEGAPVSEKTRGVVAAILAIGGYVLLTALLVSEVRGALLELPAPPPFALDWDEFRAFLDNVDMVRDAQISTLDVATTVVLAVVAIVLLAAGFIMKDAFHRYLGLVVFIGTIGKLAAYDVWNLPRLYQVVVLTIVGVLLIASGFLYARLKGLFAEGAAGSAVLLFIALLPAYAHADTDTSKVDVSVFNSRRVINGASRAGYFAVPVDPVLYEKSLSVPRLSDVRVTREGFEVPFVVRPVPANRPARWANGRIYDPGDLPEGAFRATFELPANLEHCEVNLRLDGQGAFLRRTQIESGEPGDYQTIAEGAIVYAVLSEGERYVGTRVRYPTSLARFIRVTLMPDPDAERTEIVGAQFGCVTPDAVEPRLETTLDILEVKRDDDNKRTHVTLDARRPGVPLDRIALTIQTKEYVRRVNVAASDYKQVWPTIGSGVVQRVARADILAVERTDVSFRPSGKRYFRLTFEDGDDAPLSITGAVGSYRAQQIVFSTTAAGPHFMYVGQADAMAPHYDLEAILQRKDTIPLILGDASLGPIHPNPDAGQGPRTDLPWTEQHRGAIGIALVVLMLLLAAWAVRLFVKR